MPDLSELRSVFSGGLLTEFDETAPFLTDWRRQWRGKALAVVQPDTAADVAAVARWCHARRTPMVPQGGNTGLSGGCVPDESGASIVVSLARLNRMRALDPINNTVTVEAGRVLAQVQVDAQEAGRLFPLSLAAEGSCTIGGNLATNAGGVGVLRYGMARDLCLGLEVVTPDGQIWDGLRGLRKDNTGYDLRDLFIGSEGTLGIITAAVLKLFPRPRGRAVAFAGVEAPGDALRLFDIARNQFGAGLSACELVSRDSLELVLRHNSQRRDPFGEAWPWYVLLEVSDLESPDRAQHSLATALEAAFEAGVLVDAVVSSSESQAQALWWLREDVSEAQAQEGPSIKHDIALPISRVADFVVEMGGALQARWPGARPIIFGHLGDGNLHFNVSPREGVDRTTFLSWQVEMNRLVHDAVARQDGSISAEHGLGVLRRDEAARHKSPVELGLMRALKTAIDPRGLMNPGKLLPD